MTRIAAAAGCFLLAFAATAAPVYQLFPVRGVFYADEGSAAAIDPDFRGAIGPGELAFFESRFRERFPEAAKTISEGNHRRTFAVSLQVARASRYTVKKVDGTIDLYAPVTASLYFTNLATGEVLYAATRTTIKVASVLPADAEAGSARVRSLFQLSFRDVAGDLIGDAKARFQPSSVSATVRKVWQKLAILDGGAQRGLRVDDTLVDDKGNELRILSVEESYAVGALELGSAAPGQVFAKTTNQTLAEIRKPRVLPLVASAPAGIPEETVTQLFSDALGARAPVSLIPVNRVFGAVLRTAGAQIDLTQEALLKRALPELFLRLSVPEPVSYERPTNLAYKRLRVTLALAFAELVNRDGRVLFTASASDKTEDEITEGMALDLRARREIAVKNVLLALANRFSSGLPLERSRFPILLDAGGAKLRDESASLLPGTTLRAYRSIGTADGIAGDIFAPTWDLRVDAAEGDAVRISTGLPVVDGAPALAAGDVAVVEGAGLAAHGRRRFGACDPWDPLQPLSAMGRHVEQLGAIALPDYAELATNLFITPFGAPFYLDLSTQVSALLRGGAFQQELKLAAPAIDVCVQPVYRIDAGEPTCADGHCAQTAQVKLTYRLREGGPQGEVTAKGAAEAKLTATSLPQESSADVRDAALHLDLLEQVLKVAPLAAAEAAKQKL